MNNFTPFNQNQTPNFQNFQNFQQNQFFLQPQGNLYMINNSNEINNVPVGLGLSAAICLNEGVFYLKTIQNGSPMIVGYKLNSLEEKGTMDANINQNGNSFENRISSILNDFEKRIGNLEGKNTDKNSKGGKPEWQL